ncbi:MAG: urea transporter, partial [Deltaproteobacteria bacterium]|nr:urea transporter [Deltaproteobacteria bacterium]
MNNRVKFHNVLTLSHWEMLCAKVRPLRVIDTILRSCGQVIFADHPLTGLLMLVSMALLSSAAFLFTLTGASISSLSAFLLKEDKFYIAKGIFGFNGALLGIFWSWYFLISVPSIFIFICMAIIITVVQSAMMTLLSYGRYNLPVMSLPAVAVFIFSLLLIYWLVFNAGVLHPLQIYIPLDTPLMPLFQIIPQNTEGVWGLMASYKLHVWGMILAGIFVHSRINFAAAIFFTVSGLIFMMILPHRWVHMGAEVFLGFNILPLSIALFGLLIVASRQAFLYTCLAFFICFGLWFVISDLFLKANLPFLTLPFNLTVIVALMFAKITGVERFGIVTVPLDMVTTPEHILKMHKAALSKAPPRQGGLPRQGQYVYEKAGSAPNHPNIRHDIQHILREKIAPLRITRKDIERFLDLVCGSNKISVLSGAGTSTESGIPDFRGNSSYWRQYGSEDFTYQNFLTRQDVRERYWAMDRHFYQMITTARPNDIHRAIKCLDEQGKLDCVVTQNVDGLFQRAGVGPSKIIEVHGTALRVSCLNCGTVYPRQELEGILETGEQEPHCQICHGLLKPMTILMGEDLN